jgi:hypothetical protein
MAKIFCGSGVYEVTNANQACEVMDRIARAYRGTFESYPCGEKGFWVNQDDTVNLGEGRKLYRIKGANGKYYAETDSRNLFE